MVDPHKLGGPGISVPITRPWFDEQEARAVSAVLESGWVAQGPQVEAFEEAVANYVGVRYAVATSSGTTALHLALLAAGIGEGDEVLVPAFTFVATANAVEHCGAKPVFADIDRISFNLDPRQLEARITRRTRAILPVHLFGLVADMPAILEIARQHDLIVIEDAACALGSRDGGKHVGASGLAGCFSFHPRKVITTGEGGMLVSEDAALVERVRSLRNHGAAVTAPTASEGNPAQLPDFEAVGFNYRMTDLQGAIGLAQMEKLPSILQRRRDLAERYQDGLRDIPWLSLPQVPSGTVHSFQSYVVLVEHDAPLTVAEMASRLEERGIATRQGTHAIPALSAYRTRYDLAAEDFPSAWQAHRQSLALPLYPTMPPQEHEFVVDTIRRLPSGRARSLSTATSSTSSG